MAGKFLTNWTDDDAAALTAWVLRCAALGIDVETTRPVVRGSARESVKAPSDSAAVRAALRFALTHAGREQKIAETEAGLSAVGAKSEALRPLLDKVAPENPLRALRESAGLSQVQMAQRMGVARRTVQIAEARASVSAAMMARATKAIGGGE